MNRHPGFGIIGFLMGCALFAGRYARADTTDPAEISKLVARLRDEKLATKERDAIYENLLDQGEPGWKRLAALLSREYPLKAPEYLQRLEHAAAETLKAKFGRDTESEVTTLRKSALDVVHERGLTEKQITERLDPPMKRLEELLSVKAEDVLAKQPELNARRDEVIGILIFYQRAVDLLPEKSRKELAKELGDLPDGKAREREFYDAEVAAMTAAIPMSAADRRTLQENAPLLPQMDIEVARAIERLNIQRIRLGIAALAIDPKLCAAARGHSTDMKEKKFFSHVSPVAGKESFSKRARLAGSSASAENIADGTADGADVIAMWWHSPGHLKNMLDAHRRVGIGRAGQIWTQMFGD